MLKVINYYSNKVDGSFEDIYTDLEDLRKDHPDAEVITGYGVHDTETGYSPNDAADWYATYDEAQAFIDAAVQEKLEEATMSDHGFIALGKYSSARDSILHYLCEAEWSNDSFGDVEAPTGYVWRISNYDHDVAEVNNEFGSVLAGWFEENPEVKDSPELRAELVGFWIVNEDSNGFIHVMDAQNQQTQNEIFAMLQGKFEEWLGPDED